MICLARRHRLLKTHSHGNVWVADIAGNSVCSGSTRRRTRTSAARFGVPPAGTTSSEGELTCGIDGLVRRDFLRPVRVPRDALALTEAGAEAP